jgi:hypothetical protein
MLDRVVPGDAVDMALCEGEANFSSTKKRSVSLLIRKENFSFSRSLESGVVIFDFLSTDVLARNIIKYIFLESYNSNRSSFILVL